MDPNPETAGKGWTTSNMDSGARRAPPKLPQPGSKPKPTPPQKPALSNERKQLMARTSAPRKLVGLSLAEKRRQAAMARAALKNKSGPAGPSPAALAKPSVAKPSSSVALDSFLEEMKDLGAV